MTRRVVGPQTGGLAARGALWVVLLALFATLLAGLAIKGPCVSGDWSDGRQYGQLCYSDIIPLYSTEQLGEGRLPYLDRCERVEGTNCDEYPVLTMWTLRLAAYPVDSPAGFFAVNAVLLAFCAALIAVWLYMLTGLRALLFALAPTLAIYAFMNWDLIAVALATAGTFAYLRKRNVTAGILLGLGAATKLYPLLLVIPFIVGRFKDQGEDRDPDGGIRLAWAAAGAWLIVNLPFMLLAPKGWFEFFRFNSLRAPDWDSLWFIGCDRIGGSMPCPAEMTSIVNAASLVLFLVSVAIVWWLRTRRAPTFPRWTLGFPIIVLFLLTSKVYSPQYGLWLLPWFVLAVPNVWLFVLFEVADVAVFVSRFSYFGRISTVPGTGLPFWAFEVAIVARTLILIVCLVAWVRSREGPPLARPIDEESDVEEDTPPAQSGDALPAPTT